MTLSSPIDDDDGANDAAICLDFPLRGVFLAVPSNTSVDDDLVLLGFRIMDSIVSMLGEEVEAEADADGGGIDTWPIDPARWV